MPQIKLNQITKNFYKEINKNNEQENNIKQVLFDYIISTRGIDQYQTLKQARNHYGKEYDLLKNLEINALLIISNKYYWFESNTQVMKVKNDYYVWFSTDLLNLII